MAGFDQKSNVVLSDSKERVYSIEDGVEEVPLGLYLVKGDMMYADHPLPHLPTPLAHLLLLISCSHLLIRDEIPTECSSANWTTRSTAQSISLLSMQSPSRLSDIKNILTIHPSSEREPIWTDQTSKIPHANPPAFI